MKVKRFETGAVRELKEYPTRWDLISGIALKEVGALFLSTTSLSHANNSPLDLVGMACNSIYSFIGGQRNIPVLCYAFRYVAIGVQYLDSTPEQIVALRELRERNPYGDGSNGHQLIPYAALRRLAATCLEGAEKYGEWNWLHGFTIQNTLSHALDHLYCICNADTTEDHWGHALWNLMASIHNFHSRPDLMKGLPDKFYVLSSEIETTLEARHNGLGKSAVRSDAPGDSSRAVRRPGDDIVDVDRPPDHTLGRAIEQARGGTIPTKPQGFA